MPCGRTELPKCKHQRSAYPLKYGLRLLTLCTSSDVRTMDLSRALKNHSAPSDHLYVKLLQRATFPMPQSMMAFLAMMIASIAAFNQMGSKAAVFDQMVRSEYELMANAVVIERMEVVAVGTDFDDLDKLHGDVEQVSFTAGSLSIEFTLTYQVRYVDSVGGPSGIVTSQQEVEITAENDRFSVPLVTHSRIFTE